jgi:hypothetical protein
MFILILIIFIIVIVTIRNLASVRLLPIITLHYPSLPIITNQYHDYYSGNGKMVLPAVVVAAPAFATQQ